MKRIAEPIITEEHCKYGCGQIAKYRNGSGNLMCDVSHNKCPSNKKKNGDGVKNCGRDYTLTYEGLPDETKSKMAWRKNARYAEFAYNGKGNHKSALLLERGWQCEGCGLTKWMDRDIPLELEHVDADRKNNTKENLKLLCPNCHALTPTWRRGNTEGWKRKRYTDEEMAEAITTSYNLNQVLSKLDLRYGSASTIIDCMSRLNLVYCSDQT